MLLKLLFSALLLIQAFCNAAPQSKHFGWGTTRIRGVNLGGWLILEPFITPGLFDNVPGQVAVDEWTFCQYYGPTRCHQILEQHWSTWITETDIQNVKKFGMNSVRIPIGYWAFQQFGDTPFVMGAQYWLDKAIQWCRAAGLYVIIDLHGAPLSQNGFDHSGHQISPPGWGTGDSIQNTLQVIQIITDKYTKPAYKDVVMGIELLNEPLQGAGVITVDMIRSYYTAAWQNIRQTSRKAVILHDAFLPVSDWNDFLYPSTSTYAAIDHHYYQVFDNYHVALSAEGHRAAVCSEAAGNWGNHAGHWTVIGEWSAAMTDCAPGLNGYHTGSRYAGTFPGSTRVGSCAGKNDVHLWSQQTIADHRWYVETQMEAFDRYALGWMFWTLKTARAGEWDLYKLIEVGAFPQPLSARIFPNYCGF